MNIDRVSFRPVLLLGDLLVLALVTLLGFATHGELATAGLRLLSTFIPLCAAWGLVAPWLGLFSPSITQDARQLWRPVLAAILAAPLAGWLRGFWLNAPILPVFVLVMAGTMALSLAAWRGIWLFIRSRQVNYG